MSTDEASHYRGLWYEPNGKGHGPKPARNTSSPLLYLLVRGVPQSEDCEGLELASFATTPAVENGI